MAPKIASKNFREGHHPGTTLGSQHLAGGGPEEGKSPHIPGSLPISPPLSSPLSVLCASVVLFTPLMLLAINRVSPVMAQQLRFDSPNGGPNLGTNTGSSGSSCPGGIPPTALQGGGEAYTLGAGDRIQIDIFNVPEYSGENGRYQVLVDGTINMPLIGKISVLGLTIDQTANQLRRAYQPYLQRPELLTVKLLGTRPLQIGIAGEVNRPGSYTIAISTDTEVRLPTLTRAIQLGGGITQAADIRCIVLTRPQVGRVTIDLTDLVQFGDLSKDINLRDGDTIFVPTTTSFDALERRQLATASVAGDPTQPVNIVVVGEVTKPGSYTITRVDENGGLLTITRALQAAGGVTLSAEIGQVQVIRRPKAGNPQNLQVNLRELLYRGDLSQDIILQQGDTILVPTAANPNPAEATILATANFAADTSKPLNIAVVGEVNRPGTYTVAGADVTATLTQENLTAPNTQGAITGLPTVTRAIKIAGGITAEADIREIQVRRQPKSGPVQTITVNLWELLETGDLSRDIILQQGDTISVPTATTIDLAEAPQLATASFSPNSISINVVGQVVRPGVVQLPPNSSLNQALLSVGGFDDSRAETKEVELIRLNPNGTVFRQVVPVDFAQGLDEETNPTLRHNDVIVVNRSGLTRTRDTLGKVGGAIGAVANPIFSLFGFIRFFSIF
ncbi:SLBB domain-containing protein [[Phormidium] sp. ETS-05]|uniref:polysaccharide biosynthesis/export family protein n=1 Tax=[Phormidium] sp. ETS-05 TaxID=222819 RepID=UPI0018EF2E1D|nr:SLBB domain-containing protein [[Phormidium] sp. ETS-05]